MGTIETKNRKTVAVGSVSAGTVARTIVLGLALVNQLLAATGRSPLPIEDDTVNMLVTTLFTAGAALVTWWKNNSFTMPAIKADEYLERELHREDE